MEIKVEELLEKTITDEVIIFQTDTVYGIGCLLSSQKGVETLYEIKKRDGRKPLAVLCFCVDDVKDLVKEFEIIKPFALAYWPGALTLICPKSDAVPDYVTSGLDSVGLRIPNDEIALRILRRFGPMAVTSLNLSNEPAITLYQDARSYVDVVDYLVVGRDLNGISSTVYDPILHKTLRQGDIIIK